MLLLSSFFVFMVIRCLLIPGVVNYCPVFNTEVCSRLTIVYTMAYTHTHTHAHTRLCVSMYPAYYICVNYNVSHVVVHHIVFIYIYISGAALMVRLVRPRPDHFFYFKAYNIIFNIYNYP